MKAALYRRTGAAREVIEIADVPKPEPQAGEVRVRIAYSGVNPSDTKARSGIRGMPSGFVIPHSDGSGIIDAVGQGVSSSRAGEAVWIWNAQWGRPFGTAAEYVAVPSRQAVRLPGGVDLAMGAALGVPAFTAWHAVNVDGGVAGKSVLVAGAAGAVGQYAIQFAKLAGAKTVVGTVSSAVKAALARVYGADDVIDYRAEDLMARAKTLTGGKGFDRIVEVDFAVNVAQYHGLLAPDGEVVVYGTSALNVPLPVQPLILLGAALRFFIVYSLPDAVRDEGLAAINQALVKGQLQHRLGPRFPLEEAADAHEAVETGATGKVLLDLTPLYTSPQETGHA